MKRNSKLLCSCGTVVGRQVFSHIDDRLKAFSGGTVYKYEYNGKEARTPDGMLIPLRGNQYLCKSCYMRRNNHG